MNKLKITDNRDWTEIAKCVLDNEQPLTNEEVEAIKPNVERIANIKIANLKLDDNLNLLVFPQALGYYGDEIGEGVIISLSDNKIRTNNIMGFVGVNDTQIDIRSRFAKGVGEDYFLHYMLQKVFSINLFKIEHTTSNEQIFDFLLYMFPYFLKKAVAQGVFKKYRRFEYNDANIRGPIDVSRHIRQNIPFCGTVAYSTREHTYDNELTQLVRHTIEYIRTKEQGAAILNNDTETKNCVGQIVQATPSYNVRERQRVINRNLRPVRHPYFSAYTELQKICLQILRHESIKYGQEKDKIYGILFDGAWLWEEYLNTILKKEGFKHPKNKESRGGIKMFAKPEDEDFFDRNSRRLYPDFWKDNYIIDAKYKRLEKGVGREDLYQVVTYMHCMKADNGGFMYPSDTAQKIERYTLAGLGGTMRLYGVKVQHEGDFKGYAEAMREEEERIKKAVVENSIKNLRQSV
ncbi:MAG: hypothetical protein J6T98_13360 [Salinivirgaceae bacterium]|nr:hypothetical protein [Salinivirgaceae bacterium]